MCPCTWVWLCVFIILYKSDVRFNSLIWWIVGIPKVQLLQDRVVTLQEGCNVIYVSKKSHYRNSNKFLIRKRPARRGIWPWQCVAALGLCNYFFLVKNNFHAWRITLVVSTITYFYTNWFNRSSTCLLFLKFTPRLLELFYFSLDMELKQILVIFRCFHDINRFR